MALIDTLVSWWKLDEASGNALDAHGSNTLTDNNTVGTASGKVGGSNGRDFESSSSEYFSRASNAGLQAGDIDFCIGVWLKIESKTGQNQRIVAKRAGAGSIEYFLIFLDATNRLQWIVSNDGSASVGVVSSASLGALSTGVWYFVLCWHDATNNQIGIAVNGFEATASHSTGIFVGTSDFRLGYTAEAGSAAYFDGVLDETFIGKFVPTSTQRSQLYNSGNGQPYERLVAPFAGSGFVSATGLSIAATLEGMGFATQGAANDGGFSVNTIDPREVVSWSVSGTTLTLNLDRPILFGELGITYDYAGSAVVDTEGHTFQSFTGKSVTNGSLFDGTNRAGRRRRNRFGRGPLAFAR